MSFTADSHRRSERDHALHEDSKARAFAGEERAEEADRLELRKQSKRLPVGRLKGLKFPFVLETGALLEVVCLACSGDFVEAHDT